MKNLVCGFLVVCMSAASAFASPSALSLSYTYGGTNGNLEVTVKLNKPCSAACNLRLRGAVNFEGLSSKGSKIGNFVTRQFRGNNRTFKFSVRGMPALRSYKGQDGILTLQARIEDSKRDSPVVFSDAVAHFVECGTGNRSLTQDLWLRTLKSRVR